MFNEMCAWKTVSFLFGSGGIDGEREGMIGEDAKLVMSIASHERSTAVRYEPDADEREI